MSPAETLVLRPAALPPLSRMVLGVAVLVMTWETRRRTRQHLRARDAHMLKDIGIDPVSAMGEAVRPFWRH
jgi:uncharacterized protein YjiS (DUF1127 family)